ncbi:galactokinase [Bianquea renquensis]|uniref:Galactokinase n=1 Tax=Bianquea renquensis TaxID=2763661 RepID=A0A926DR96_9FIRM|nr:galactokinase family protein [Bianquea renquensis]MBC8542593.1 galactokinase [Bianquea renquensis]
MRIESISTQLHSPEATALFRQLYGADRASSNVLRYEHLAQKFVETFGNMEFEYFSSPGRTEISGNHTDHNHGKILAGSIHLDCVAVAAKTDSGRITIVDETYQERYDLSVTDRVSNETTGTLALLKGLLAGFQERGLTVGGFNAYVATDVISAAGVSSSASFEMLICCILNTFYHDGALDVVTLAKIGKYAENQYWNKQSGLLDQLSCAVGGIITIDFANIDAPSIQKVDFSFDDVGYDLVIVNTGKGHADLSAEYSSIPTEMKAVAAYFGCETLSEVALDQVRDNVDALRKAVGDRAVLRAFHFFTENERVEGEILALRENRFEDFLDLVTRSGNSSWKWLQNCYSICDCQEQSVTLALALTELYLAKLGQGACRVHGGGFAGVIMALLPKGAVADYSAYMEKALGSGCTYPMRLRPLGSIRVPF